MLAAAGCAVAVAVGAAGTVAVAVAGWLVAVGTAEPGGTELDIALGAGEAAPCARATMVRADPTEIHTAAATVKYFTLCCPSIALTMLPLM